MRKFLLVEFPGTDTGMRECSRYDGFPVADTEAEMLENIRQCKREFNNGFYGVIVTDSAIESDTDLPGGAFVLFFRIWDGRYDLLSNLPV